MDTKNTPKMKPYIPPIITEVATVGEMTQGGLAVSGTDTLETASP